MRAALLALVFLLASLASCRSTPTEAFQLAFASGTRAQHAGRYEEAIGHYRTAQRAARRLKDRDEAVFLVARMYEALLQPEKALAVYDELVALSPDGPRRVRAELAAATIAERLSRADGRKRYEALVRGFRDDELTELALDRLLALEEEDRGLAGRLALAKELLAPSLGKRVEEHVRYKVASALRATGKLAEARDLFIAGARKFPYPKGALTDDALFQAAEIEQELGRPKEALALLRELLSPRELTAIGSSYERPRFAQAQLRIAEILRDSGDSPGARTEYRKLYSLFTTSIYRDDALWEEAKLWVKDGKGEEACRTLELLAKDFPASRYVNCSFELCSRIGAGKRECPGYLSTKKAAAE